MRSRASDVHMARYHGTCPDCGGRWQPGDRIRACSTLTENGLRCWHHAECPDDLADPTIRPGETVCTRCWLVHPDGACDR